MDKDHCIFCNGKEMSIALLTGQGYPIGEKCFHKAMVRFAEWSDSTSLTELKKLIRKRQK